MHFLVIRSARLLSLRASVRTFASTTSRCQAVPTEKPVHLKEFKIYRWVCVYSFSVSMILRHARSEPGRTGKETHSSVLHNRFESNWSHGEHIAIFSTLSLYSSHP